MDKIQGNIVGLPSPRSDWEQTNENKADYIKNKPEIVTSITKVATDKQIPSAKSVFDLMQNVTSWTEVDAMDVSDFSFLNEYVNKSYALKFIFCGGRNGYALVMNDHTVEPEQADQYVFCEGDIYVRTFSWDRESKKYLFLSETRFVKSGELAKKADKSVVDAILAPPIKEFPTILSPNKSYNFNEVPSKIEFSSIANNGDVIYLTFMVGNESPTIEFITTNTSDYELIPEINTGYEIYAKFNGTVWIVGYSEFTVPEGESI